MENIIITEGKTDVELLRSLLKPEGNENGSSLLGHIHKYIAAGGRSSVGYLARSYLTNPKYKVLVVTDADSIDPDIAEERRLFLNRSLDLIADDSRWCVIVIVPEIEKLLFDDRTVIESIVRHEISDQDFIEGRYRPKETLEKIAGTRRSILYERLNEVNLESIRNSPEIRSIRQFFSPKRKKVLA